MRCGMGRGEPVGEARCSLAVTQRRGWGALLPGSTIAAGAARFSHQVLWLTRHSPFATHAFGPCHASHQALPEISSRHVAAPRALGGDVPPHTRAPVRVPPNKRRPVWHRRRGNAAAGHAPLVPAAVGRCWVLLLVLLMLRLLLQLLLPPLLQRCRRLPPRQQPWKAGSGWRSCWCGPTHAVQLPGGREGRLPSPRPRHGHSRSRLGALARPLWHGRGWLLGGARAWHDGDDPPGARTYAARQGAESGDEGTAAAAAAGTAGTAGGRSSARPGRAYGDRRRCRRRGGSSDRRRRWLGRCRDRHRRRWWPRGRGCDWGHDGGCRHWHWLRHRLRHGHGHLCVLLCVIMCNCVWL
jgi:hypothetical protein